MAADRNHKGYVTDEDLLVEIRMRADANHDGVVIQEEIQRAMQSGAFAKPAEREKRPDDVQKK